MAETDMLEKCKIRVCGKGKAKEEAEKMLCALPLHGNEPKDRLMIQQMLDENKKLKVTILYDGNTVYPYQKYLDGLKTLFKSDDLSKLTDDMYHFLSGHFDIAHYDKNGYIQEYDGSFSTCWHSLRFCIPRWYTDLSRIIDGFREFMEHPVKDKKQRTKCTMKGTGFMELDTAMATALDNLSKADLSAMTASVHNEQATSKEVVINETETKKGLKKIAKKGKRKVSGQLDFAYLFDAAI